MFTVHGRCRISRIIRLKVRYPDACPAGGAVRAFGVWARHIRMYLDRREETHININIYWTYMHVYLMTMMISVVCGAPHLLLLLMSCIVWLPEEVKSHQRDRRLLLLRQMVNCPRIGSDCPPYDRR